MLTSVKHTVKKCIVYSEQNEDLNESQCQIFECGEYLRWDQTEQIACFLYEHPGLI